MLDTKTNFVDEKVKIDPKDLQVSFGDNTTETKDEKTNNENKIVKVSLGKDLEALAEEKSKPKEKQDKDKIKQLEKSIKNREKEIKRQVENNTKYKVFAVVAPSIGGNFVEYKNGQIISALKKIGFYDVAEAALGADIVAFEETKELVERSKLTSSCCL